MLRMKRVDYRPCRCGIPLLPEAVRRVLARLLPVLLVAVIPLVASAQSRDLPRVDEILAIHEKLAEEVATGRVEIVLERSRAPGALAAEKKRGRESAERYIRRIEKSDLPEDQKKLNIEFGKKNLAISDEIAVALHLSATGTRRVSFTFDKVAGAFIAEVVDPRDRDELIREHGLGTSGAANLDKVRVRALSGGFETEYSSGANTASICPAIKTFRLACQDLLEAGFLSRRYFGPDHRVSIAESADHPGMLQLVVSSESMRFRGDMTLDPSMGFRIVESKLYGGDRLVVHETCSFRLYDDVLFPAEYSRTTFGEDGPESERYRVKSAELNVQIDPSEFIVEVPGDSVIYDKMSGARITKLSEARERLLQINAEKMCQEMLQEYAAAMKEKAVTRVLEESIPPPLLPVTQGPSQPLADRDAPVESTPGGEVASEPEQEGSSAGTVVIAGLLVAAVVGSAAVFVARKRRGSAQ